MKIIFMMIQLLTYAIASSTEISNEVSKRKTLPLFAARANGDICYRTVKRSKLVKGGNSDDIIAL